MALIKCTECGNAISDKAAACPQCGAPNTSLTNGVNAEAHDSKPITTEKKKKATPLWVQVVAGLVGAWVAVSCATGGSSGAKNETKSSWNEISSLTLCQMAIKRRSRDPENAEVPYVKNFGSSSEHYFAWGADTKMARLRNGLGIDVASTASCTVDVDSRRITSLTINGETMIDK